MCLCSVYWTIAGAIGRSKFQTQRFVYSMNFTYSMALPSAWPWPWKIRQSSSTLVRIPAAARRASSRGSAREGAGPWGRRSTGGSRKSTPRTSDGRAVLRRLKKNGGRGFTKVNGDSAHIEQGKFLRSFEFWRQCYLRTAVMREID